MFKKLEKIWNTENPLSSSLGTFQLKLSILF